MDSSRTATEEGSSYEQKTLELLQLAMLTRSRKVQIRRCRRHLNRDPWTSLNMETQEAITTTLVAPAESTGDKGSNRSSIPSISLRPKTTIRGSGNRQRICLGNMVQGKFFGWFRCRGQVELLETQAVARKVDLGDRQSDAQEGHTAE